MASQTKDRGITIGVDIMDMSISWECRNPGRFGRGSFLPGSFRPYFGVSRFGLFWWVVSAVSRFGLGSFLPV